MQINSNLYLHFRFLFRRHFFNNGPLILKIFPYSKEVVVLGMAEMGPVKVDDVFKAETNNTLRQRFYRHKTIVAKIYLEVSIS